MIKDIDFRLAFDYKFLKEILIPFYHAQNEKAILAVQRAGIALISGYRKKARCTFLL